MTEFQREPKPETLAEFSDYAELLAEAGRGVIELEDALGVAEQRDAASHARRNVSGSTADRIGRGRL